ncbi:hypothetical protein CLV84_0868 [Neolewinella xylanilytica]|uniref:1,4-alpha-glucan branching enzyme n=1 Tax=Neolewinella xylanilytica TaxID=1514080 RepID=A0A2S6I8V6_9BACT|nr:hypothetical protein [Neolewinella xylanilytica]PPK87909.1 hypothetical protein CLV84_0868 [Neolewinella xylanilytica]
MADTTKTTDHDAIKKWVTDRNGAPAKIEGTDGGDGEMIRVYFEQKKENADLKKIGWDEWFKQFDKSKLALLHSTEAGNTFNKLVSRD